MNVKAVSEDQKDFGITLGVFVIGFLIFLFLGWFVLPGLAYVKKTQSMDFRHASHVEGVGIACDACHFFYEDGSWAGIPALDVCADCHADTIGQSPEEKRFVEEYVKQNKEVDWALYFRQPECVSFSHSSHVRRAGILCKTCHGPQGHSEHPAEYLTNRITKYSYVVYDPNVPFNAATLMSKKGEEVWGTLRMDECASCHRERGQSTACFICHK